MPRIVMLVLVVMGCVAPQVRHGCPERCPTGQVCDLTVGQCMDDPCGGKCTPSQKCRAGPPAKCIDLAVGEVKTAGPGEPSGAAEPAATPTQAPPPPAPVTAP